jgi:hypothetical protein
VQIDLDGNDESRQMLWRKAKGSWQYVYDNFGDDYDWFLRADDDSYVNMDNMREYLAAFDPSKDYYMGRLFFMGGRDEKVGWVCVCVCVCLCALERGLRGP